MPSGLGSMPLGQIRVREAMQPGCLAASPPQSPPPRAAKWERAIPRCWSSCKRRSSTGSSTAVIVLLSCGRMPAFSAGAKFVPE